MRVVALALLFSGGLLAQSASPTNLDFETGTVGQTPTGWGFGSNPTAGLFQGVLVEEGCIQGSRCAMLTGSASPPANSFGTLTQSILPDRYLLRRIRYRAALRVEGSGTFAQLWLRVDRQGGGSSFFYNMSDRPVTSAQWNYYEFDGLVVSDSSRIFFGIIIIGSGRVFVDDASFEITGQVREDPPDEPRPLSETGLANLTAFARLLGYVRHFHPSDQVVQVDWEVFAVQGVRAAENAATPEDLAVALRALFDPVAPTVRIFLTGSRPALPPELRPVSRDGLQLVRWSHYGARLGSSSNIYQSQRSRAAVSSGQLPAGFPDPAQPFEAEIGRGLSVMVPLSLYADAQGTLPARPSQVSSDIYLWNANSRATRLGGVILAWNVFQHFYPYFDVVDTDWPAALTKGLREAATESGPEGHQTTLEHLVAALKDGHGSVNRAQTIYWAPLVWDWVENQLIITRTKAAAPGALRRGDRVLRIDGQSVEEALRALTPLISGATPQWITWVALRRLAYCNSQTRRMEIEIEPYGSPGASSSVGLACVPLDGDWSEPRGEIIRELEPGILYVDLDRLILPVWNEALPRLATAAGIVFDLRGYPRFFPTSYLGNLSQTQLSSAQWHVPTPAKPDRVDLTFTQSNSFLEPQQPYFTARRVILVDGRTISAAETIMGIVENYKLAEIVGGPTAGTNGNVNPFTVPGGFTLYWTGMKVLKHDGSQHHGIGIRPTIPATRTRQGIAEGRDEVLARGQEIVKGPKPGPAPAIAPSGIVNAANFAPGPVAPGEIVTIFGRDLGPSQLAQTSYDASGFLGNYAGETRVFFDGIQASLVYASSTQVSAIVPYQVNSSTKVRLEYQGRSSNEVTLSVTAAAPGIFAYGGRSQAVAINQNQSLNSEANPAARGELLTLFVTGEGPTTPSGINGKLPAAGKWPVPVGRVTVTFGGIAAEVQFAGVTYAGVLQLNVRVPPPAPVGNAVPVVVSIGGIPSAGSRSVALRN